MIRKWLAQGMVGAGFVLVSSGAWLGLGAAAGLGAGGILMTVFGLVFVDVDKDGG